MPFATDNFNVVFRSNPIDQPVFSINSSAPKSCEVVFQRFRFSFAFKRVSFNVDKQFVNLFVDRFVDDRPVEKLVKSILLKDKISFHYFNFESTISSNSFSSTTTLLTPESRSFAAFSSRSMYSSGVSFFKRPKSSDEVMEISSCREFLNKFFTNKTKSALNSSGFKINVDSIFFNCFKQS